MKPFRVFVTDLACYNEGALIGKWITLPCDIEEEIQDVLLDGESWSRKQGYLEEGGEHEEVFITDYEAPYSISEYANLEALNEQAEQLEGLDDCETKKVVYLIKQLGYDPEKAIEDVDTCVLYEGMTMEDVAYEQVEEGLFGTIPQSILNYIDYGAIARDMDLDGYDAVDGDVYCVD